MSYRPIANDPFWKLVDRTVSTPDSPPCVRIDGRPYAGVGRATAQQLELFEQLEIPSPMTARWACCVIFDHLVVDKSNTCAFNCGTWECCIIFRRSGR